MKLFKNSSTGFLILFLTIFFFYYNYSIAQPNTLTEGSYSYEVAENDPLNARIYTLKNGLKVYMSVYKDEPRIQTYIAVRAGSKNDPQETTGLAHYLEHMLFKGTNNISTQNWEVEKGLLEEISNLYEEYRQTKDSLQRVNIYHKIDSVSGVASQYAIPNEYDKMISSIGAIGTNAYTSLEQTVYVNNIPTNELEKWVVIESERMKTLVLRLFHTELEAVYEEFNIGQDDDMDKLFESLLASLFQRHTYGTQTTIGKGEHLKNPSMKKIHEYFNTYYAPNNIAICLSGDLDPQQTIEMIDKHFGNWKAKEIPAFTFEPEKPITQPVIKHVYGSQEETAIFAYRFDGVSSRDALMVELIDGILSNGRAGLIDLNINQKQTLLESSSDYYILHDYSIHILGGSPRENQPLDNVLEILLAEIEKIKNGDFNEWLIEAVINDFLLKRTKEYEHNNNRAHAFVDAFIWHIKWEDFVKRIDIMSKFTKEDIMKFAQEHYKNNYVAVFKHIGVDSSVYKVPKPAITPIALNRDAQSRFLSDFSRIKSERLTPVFVDFKNDILESKLNNGIKLHFLKNDLNNIFYLYYILDMGSNNDKKLDLALEYLPYLGTSQYTPKQLQQEFFKIGVTFDISSSEDQVYVVLSGLENSLEKGVKLFEHILANAKPDKKALEALKQGILKKRADAKLNKRMILWNGLFNYAKYGPNSSFTNILNEDELNSIKPKELVSLIKEFSSYHHRIFYYGTKNINEITDLLNRNHKTQPIFKDYPPAKNFNELPVIKSKVMFVNYDMVQSEVIMFTKSDLYHKDWEPFISMYNEYYGRGLSSIVFQEMRESRALAYSAFAGFSKPDYADKSHYIFGYIGTQVDKMPDAIKAFNYLMNNMPAVPQQFEASKNAIASKIESDRITKTSIFWDYENAKKRNISYDIRKDIYEKSSSMTIAELMDFHKETIKDKPYIFLVLGNKNRIDMKYLQSLGEVKVLSLEEIFGY